MTFFLLPENFSYWRQTSQLISHCVEPSLLFPEILDQIEVSNACRISTSNKFPQGNDREQPNWFTIWQISFIHFQRNLSRTMSCSAHGLSCFFSLSLLPGMCLSSSLTLVPGDLYSHCRAREWQGRKMPQQPLKQLSRGANNFGLLLSIKFYGLELTGLVPRN